jgi:hypothetical protein
VIRAVLPVPKTKAVSNSSKGANPRPLETEARLLAPSANAKSNGPPMAEASAPLPMAIAMSPRGPEVAVAVLPAVDAVGYFVVAAAFAPVGVAGVCVGV